MTRRLKAVACGIWNDIIQWRRGVTFVGVICFALGAIVSGPLSNLGIWAWTTAYTWMFPPPPFQPTASTIDFNATDGCFSGDLYRIRKVFMKPGVDLANGADTLMICDPQELRALEADIPKALASKIPGCLSWDDQGDGTLSLVRNSPAVCIIPGTGRFVCDADHAREPSPQASSNYKGDVAPCSEELLEKFGFPSR